MRPADESVEPAPHRAADGGRIVHAGLHLQDPDHRACHLQLSVLRRADLVEGKLVLARTEGVDYRRRRVTSLARSLFSGEPVLRLYEGTGKALVCWTPYWNRQMAEMIAR